MAPSRQDGSARPTIERSDTKNGSPFASIRQSQPACHGHLSQGGDDVTGSVAGGPNELEGGLGRTRGLKRPVPHRLFRSCLSLVFCLVQSVAFLPLTFELSSTRPHPCVRLGGASLFFVFFLLSCQNPSFNVVLFCQERISCIVFLDHGQFRSDVEAIQIALHCLAGAISKIGPKMQFGWVTEIVNHHKTLMSFQKSCNSISRITGFNGVSHRQL